MCPVAPIEGRLSQDRGFTPSHDSPSFGAIAATDELVYPAALTRMLFVLWRNACSGATSGMRSPSVIIPNGSKGHRRKSLSPCSPQTCFSDIFGKSNFNRKASHHIRVNSSNQTGAVLNISVNFSVSRQIPTLQL
jgi:hypothetical protein